MGLHGYLYTWHTCILWVESINSTTWSTIQAWKKSAEWEVIQRDTVPNGGANIQRKPLWPLVKPRPREISKSHHLRLNRESLTNFCPSLALPSRLDRGGGL